MSGRPLDAPTASAYDESPRKDLADNSGNRIPEGLL
jgi:hypothetical protein